jgi:hypothetical protein
MFKINATKRLKATQVNAAFDLDKELATFDLGKKCLQASKKAKGKGPDFEVVFDTIKLKEIPTEKQLKQAGAELAYGDLEENGTKEIAVIWWFSDGFPGVFFKGKNAAGKEQDAANSMLEPIGSADPHGDEKEFVTYLKQLDKMIAKLKLLK